MSIAEAGTGRRPNPDFEAEVRFLTPEEGGRATLPLQGWRADVRREAEPGNQCWMIWPRFLGDDGQELPDGTPIAAVSLAHFYVLDDRLRRTVHREWVREDASFYLVEGPHRVARCRVTRLLALHDERT